MNIREALVERLLTDTAAGGVFTFVATRIRPVQAAQDDVSPLLIFERQSGHKVQCLDGSTLYEQATFGLFCFADTDAVAQALALAVRARILDPTWGASSDSTIVIGVVVEEDVGDGQEAPLHAQGLAPYRVDLSFTLSF